MYKATIEFQATEFTKDITKIEDWLWYYASIWNENGEWVLRREDNYTIPVQFGDFIVLENEGLVIYPADAFHQKFTEVTTDESDRVQ